MADLKQIATRPEVKSAVLSNRAGGFLDAVRESDGETVAAVTGFLTSSIAQAGEQLGLGLLRNISFTGEARACLVFLQGDSVVTAFVEPPAAAAGLEKAFDASIKGR
jgi:hypothetical protein